MKTSVRNIWVSLLTMKANSLSQHTGEGWEGGIYKQPHIEMGENAPNTMTSCLKTSQNGEALSSVLCLSDEKQSHLQVTLGIQTGIMTASGFLQLLPPKKVI